MIEMKGLVTGSGGLCWVKYVVWWHAVIKLSPGLTAQHLFTEDFFSLTVLSLHQSLHRPPAPLRMLPRFLSLFLSLSHLPVASLSLSVLPLSLRILTQFIPATTSYQGLLSCKSVLFPSAQIHLFYHHSFLSIYTGLGGRNCWSIWAMLCVIS